METERRTSREAAGGDAPRGVSALLALCWRHGGSSPSGWAPACMAAAYVGVLIATDGKVTCSYGCSQFGL